MSRPLRIEIPGALYHITSRGDGREVIFLSDGDRGSFLDVLAEVVRVFNWADHAYCLMDNHYHLLVETPDGNLSKGMRHLNGVYTQRFNRQHGRVGHVFQGRYKALIVEKEAYLLELARYIVLNPVRAKLVRCPEEWLWSSYRATVGLCAAPSWLTTDWILGNFSTQRNEATRHYADFVAGGIQGRSPWSNLKNQIFLGSDTFVEALQSKVSSNPPLSEIPSAQQRPLPKPLADITDGFPRNEGIALAYTSGAYGMREIGDHYGLHYSRISRILKEHGLAKSKT